MTELTRSQSPLERRSIDALVGVSNEPG